MNTTERAQLFRDLGNAAIIYAAQLERGKAAWRSELKCYNAAIAAVDDGDFWAARETLMDEEGCDEDGNQTREPEDDPYWRESEHARNAGLGED